MTAIETAQVNCDCVYQYDYSTEVLMHYRCCLCNGWWSISDGATDCTFYCPHCGECLTPAQYDHEPEYDPELGELLL